MIYPNQNVFPLVDPVQHPNHKMLYISHHPGGIDLRTWMATQFMAAIIISGTRGTCAFEAVQCADALIVELNKLQEVKP